MPSASTAGPYSMQPCSAWTAGMLARNSFRIASRMPDLAVMMATTWIMFPLSGDALKDAVMAARGVWADLGRPVAKAAGFLPGRALQHTGRVELVDRQIALHAGHCRVLEPIACGGADARHLGKQREVPGVVDAVEFRRVLRG